MSCIITYNGRKYSENEFKKYFINNKQEFYESIFKNKDVIESFKRKTNNLIDSEEQTENTTEDILSTETISQTRFDKMFEQESTMTQEEIENRDKKIIEDFKKSIGCQKI